MDVTAAHRPAADSVPPGQGAREDPRWLDEDERSAWLALASLLARLPLTLERQLQHDSGLSHFEYLVMAGLSEAPGRTLRMSRIAEFAEGQLPRLSQVAARLEKRGWLTRRPDPTDGRSTLATLTDAGMAKVVDSAPGHVETVRRHVFDPLTRNQVRQLRDICGRVTSTLGDGCEQRTLR